jgi:flagellar hook-length control protein FliK
VNREQSPEQNSEQQLTVENPQNGEQKQKTASEADSTFSGQESRNQHQTTGDGEVHNVFLQNLEADKLQADGAEAASGTSGWSDETVDIMNQIMDYMKTSVKEDTSSLEMQLHPESLGTLQIHLASKGGVVTANFITQNETVKSALESQMIQLKESFEEQGVKVNAIEVTVQTHEFERNLDQGRGESKNREPARRTRIRRINLEEPMAAEDMEQADALAVDMLSAGGNTVDYTA